MNIDDYNRLRPGDQVRIVSEWNDRTCQNTDGAMDKYLGSIMTVDRIESSVLPYLSMVEDHGRWAWNCFSIEKVEYSASTDPDICSDEDLRRFFSVE